MINFQFTFFPMLVITAKVWSHIKDILIGLGGLEHLRATVSRIGFHISSLLWLVAFQLSRNLQAYIILVISFTVLSIWLVRFPKDILHVIMHLFWTFTCVWFRLLMRCPIMETHQLTFSTGKQLHVAPERGLAINQPLEPIGCRRVNDPRWDFYHFNIEQMEMV